MSAEFPTSMPELYDDKTTANDVSDASHWDGADANALKDELLAIAAKVGVDGDTSETSLDYQVTSLQADVAGNEAAIGNLDSQVTGLAGDVASLDGRVYALEIHADVDKGSGTLAASTSTVVSDANATASSVILVQATSSAFVALGAYVSAKSAGSFTLTHASAAGTETFDYLIVN